MNKQELIRKYNEKAEKEILDDNLSISRRVLFRNIARELENLELDEPQKVKIPPFVAEYLADCREYSNLAWLLYPACDNKNTDTNLSKWLEHESNQEILTRAWLDGYEVEEELFIMPVPHTEKYWYYRTFEDEFILTTTRKKAYKFTESELDEYFPKIKEFAERVEE